MPEDTVTSEIYEEFNYKTDTKASKAGSKNIIYKNYFYQKKKNRYKN